jgi:hypothetical protein
MLPFELVPEHELDSPEDCLVAKSLQVN